MRRDYVKWYSPSLHRDMELLAFGHAGFPIVVFPTSGGRFWEYEDRGMVRALTPKIDRGELQVICVDSVDQESWYNKRASPRDRLNRQNAFDAYLALELAPFVRNRTSWGRWAPRDVVSADTTPSTSRCGTPISSLMPSPCRARSNIPRAVSQRLL